MTPAEPKTSRDEVARLGQEIYERVVRPRLTPADDGKFVAIDVVTEDHEIDPDDYAAFTRLRERLPAAEMFLVRVGRVAASELRGHR